MSAGRHCELYRRVFLRAIGVVANDATCPNPFESPIEELLGLALVETLNLKAYELLDTPSFGTACYLAHYFPNTLRAIVGMDNGLVDQLCQRSVDHCILGDAVDDLELAWDRCVPLYHCAWLAMSGQHGVALCSQFEAERYRLDFALVTNSTRIAIECDGHEFHERTKEQARHDKQRDRWLVANGWKVLRFTGSEIYAAPERCAGEIVQVIFPTQSHASAEAH